MLGIFIFEICGNTLHDELHAGNGHAVPQSLVSCGIRSGWDVCPPVRETLQALALKGCQAANQVYLVDDAFIVADILVADSLVIRANQGTDGILIGLHDQIGGILMLSGTFGADHMVFLTARGAFYTDTPLEQGSRYLEQMAGFFGIEKYDCVAAEGLDIGAWPVEELMDKAKAQATEVAKTF